MIGAWLIVLILVHAARPRADMVTVRYREGVSHGFLSLKNESGQTVANGDFIQRSRGTEIVSRLVYHFKDGSIDDDVAVFTQQGHFQLISDHHVQKGPSFKQPTDTTIDMRSGRVNVRYTDDHGKEKTENEQMELPSDLANGMLITVLKNVQASALPPFVSYLASTPKPRIIKLEFKTVLSDRFVVAGSARRATHFVLKVNIGGATGLIASLLGKQPEDLHVWVMQGEAPAFVKAEVPLFFGGPVMRTELTTPVWR
jgi:hypothetical protein